MTKAQYELLAAWRHSLRQFFRFSEQAAAKEGLTAQQHQALLAIKGFPGRDWVTIGELAERLQIEHHSSVGLADRLVCEKYVRRKRDEQDRRKVVLELTEEGETALERLSAAHHAQLRQIGPDIRKILARLDRETRKKR